MLHKFTIQTQLEHVDDVMEKLNIHEYYNLYYDEPLEPREGNTIIELNIILEQLTDVERIKEKLAAILHRDASDVRYQLLEQW